jgi:hypothetical protein
MPMKTSDKAKLTAVTGLLLVLSVGSLLVYWQWPTDSEISTVSAPTTQPTVTPAAAAATIRYNDTRRFLRVVQSDDVKQATAILASNPNLAKQKIADGGITPLHVAHSVAMAQLLLDNGADINAQDTRHSATPLRWAAARSWDRDQSKLDLIHFLQSKGATEPDIYLAVAVGDIPRIQAILSTDPSLIEKPSRDNDGLFDNCAPLQIAAYAGQLDAAKFLLDHGANVHNQSGWSKTESLEKAAWTGHADVVALLLDHGAKVDGTDKDFTHAPLYNAATMGHLDVVKILLDHGAAISPRLIPEVRSTMLHPYTDGPPPGSPDEFKQVLAILSAASPPH